MKKKLKSKKINSRKGSTKFLIRSKWTSLQPVERNKHFELIEKTSVLSNSIIEEKCKLKNIVTRAIYTVSVAELSNKGRWTKGWL